MLVLSSRKRGSGQKLMYREFHLNISRNFFNVQVIKPWNGLPRELVEPPSQEVLKSHLDF